MKPFFPCSSQDGRQMIYLPLLLVNELSFRVRDLMVGRSHTLCLNTLTLAFEWNDCDLTSVSVNTFIGDQQQHGSAPSDCVLRGNHFKEVQVLGASAGRGLFPATVW